MLLVDCYLDEAGCEGNFRPFLGPHAEVVRVAHGGALPDDVAVYALVVFSGSGASVWDDRPWLAPLKAFVRRVLDARVPTLGVCFGHQLLADVVAGPGAVVEMARPEVGMITVEASPGRLFAGATRFEVFSSHKDAVDEAAIRRAGVRVVASSVDCEVQAMEIPGVPAFGVQFHPEMRMDEIQSVLARRAVQHPELHLDPAAELARARPRPDVAEALVARAVGRHG